MFKVIPQYCVSLQCTIFASLARANKGVHVHNERNFPQAKLDREINAQFSLNEHGDLYFLLHNNSVRIILFNLKRFKNLSNGKKDIDESVHKTGILGCKI